MDLIILLTLAGIVGWKLSAVWYQMAFKRLLEELGVSNGQLRKLAADNGIHIDEDEKEDGEYNDLPELEVRIEQHPEGLFAYRKQDDTFIAQGHDRETLMENLVNNLSNVRVVVAKEDGADLISP